MRILLVSPFLPHPGVRHAGGKLVHFLHEQLAARHHVTLVTRWYRTEERALRELHRKGHEVEALLAVGPWFEGGALTLAKTIASYRALVREAERIAARESFDVCQVEFTETGYFWRAGRMPPSVLTCHDLVAKRIERQNAAGQHQRSLLSNVASRAQVWAERRALRSFDRVLLLSRTEESWCRNLYPDLSTEVLRYPGGIGFEGLPRREIPGRVLFVGALGRPQNVEGLRWLLSEVWPRVRKAIPYSELAVVGAGASAALIAEMAGIEGVHAAGEMASVESAYCEAAVFAAPVLAGGGIIVKNLDALAAGVPVVTTPYGAEGLDVEPGRDLIESSTPEDFAAQLTKLLTDFELRRRLGEAGRKHVETHFPRGGVMSRLESVYQSIAR